MRFPDYLQFELGIYVESFVRWLMLNFGIYFDSIKGAILWFLMRIELFALWLPWWLVLVVVLLLGWRVKGILTGLTLTALLFLVGTFGLWELLMLTVAIVVTSVLISLILGIPMGIVMAYNNRIEEITKPLLDAMQTMPSFVYLIPAMMLFGMGKVPAVFATTIYAIAPVIRLTNLGIRQVSSEMVEAAVSFGSSTWQILTKVQIPQAMPTIMTGINQTTMMALAMVVIASMIGARGIGLEVLMSINRIDIASGFEAGLSIVILAIVIDRISQGIGDRFKIPE